MTRAANEKPLSPQEASSDATCGGSEVGGAVVDALRARIQELSDENAALREALENIAKGRWNVGNARLLTAIQYARAALRATPKHEETP